MAILRDPDLAPADDIDKAQSEHARREAEIQSILDDIDGITRGKTSCGVDFFIDADDLVTFESAIKLIDIVAFAKAVTTKQELPGVYTSASPELRKYLQLKLSCYPFELFGVVFFDSGGRFIKFSKINFGSTESVVVPVNEIVKAAIDLNADSILLCHNHPGTNIAAASISDKKITRRIMLALAGIKIHIVDHLIVTMTDVFSMSDAGLLNITSMDNEK